jgi:hypothetical protein
MFAPAGTVKQVHAAAAQQLAEADPTGRAMLGACVACRRDVEWGGSARFRRAA